MKLYFKNAGKLLDGIELLSADLGIEAVNEADAEIKVNVTECEERILKVALDKNVATIIYGDGKARFYRGLSKLVGWLKCGKTEMEVTERPLFVTNGSMVDMSRNAVMKVDYIKTMLRKMALMGLNFFMLYTEDTYEIEGYPYFGYMRGRFTKDEIKELDAYALRLGIELVPCIQVLGHLATHLRWAATAPYKDTANTMLVGAEATYTLIEKMLETISECFTTRRIHVGMDETHDLGTGVYLDKFGYKERQDIYFEHLEKIKEMCISRGFKPMMWSDMFFRLCGKNIEKFYDYHPDVVLTDEVRQKAPKGMQMVFWDYYRPSQEFYDVNIDKHFDVFGKDTMFAGGVWCWSGHCPLFTRSRTFTIPALTACKNKGIKEVISTVWHNGSECSLILSLAGIAWYADFDYTGVYNVDSVRECFENSCDGVSYDEIMNCDLPEVGHGDLISATRGMLYSDPLLGIIDKHLEGYDTANYFKDVSARLVAANGNKGIFAPAYDVIVKLSSLLENKANFGVRLKAAYDKGDKAALSELLSECDVILKKLRALHEAHRASWMEYNKPFGWEVHDIRYGGVANRFDTVKERISAYLKGEIPSIEELECDRLRLDGVLDVSEDTPRFYERFLFVGYGTFATPNML